MVKGRLRISLTLVFVTGLLVGCGVVNQLKLRVANNYLVPNWPENEIKASLPTLYIGEKPYIELSVNGVKGFKFLIDTGASITILQDTDKVKALGLTKGYELPLSGWGDEKDSIAYQSNLDSLRLANVEFSDIDIAYLPISLTKYFLRRDEAIYDGVLGHDVLRHFHWLFDKQNNNIVIGRHEYQRTGDEITIPFSSFFKRIYIDASIELGAGQYLEQELVIDTGSRHYIKLNDTFLQNEEISLPEKTVTAADFGLNGRAIHKRMRLPKLSLGEKSADHLTLFNVKANLIKSDDEDDSWVIGSGLLNQFISVVDYHSEQLHLISYPNKKFQTRFNLLGLELRKLKNGNFVVRYVFPELMAADADIKEGDVITSMNGILSPKLSQEQWLEYSAKPGEYNICRKRIIIKCLELKSFHIPGYSTDKYNAQLMK